MRTTVTRDLQDSSRASDVVSPRLARRVRRLREHDRPETLALLRQEPGASLFVLGTLETLGLRTDFARFWGLFTAGKLTAVLMMVDQRAAFYAPRGTDIAQLVAVARAQQMDFTMGRADLVEATLAAPSPVVVERYESHLLAELVAVGVLEAAARVSPTEVTVARAVATDLRALASLYTGAAGFESLSPLQVERIVAGRISGTRTFLARAGADAAVVAAASTTAETGGAAMIGGVWTAPGWRGRGIGTAVVAALARDLIASGRTPFLFYLRDNAAAARVYAKLGFMVVDRWMVVYFDGCAIA